MENTKDSVQLLNELQTLITARKIVKFKNDIGESIADKAEEFVTTLNAELDDEVEKFFEPSESPTKSEMPCNCHSTEEKTEIKPCPFCGNKEVEFCVEDKDGKRKYPRIICGDCNTLFRVMLSDISTEQLVQHWNTRNAEVKSENFKQVIEDAAERVKNFDNKKMAAVIIAPLEDILDTTD